MPQVIEAEVRYMVRHEYTQPRGQDRLACHSPFFNTQAAPGALPQMVEITAEDLGWNYSQQQTGVDRATSSSRVWGSRLALHLHPRRLIPLWSGVTGEITASWTLSLRGCRSTLPLRAKRVDVIGLIRSLKGYEGASQKDYNVDRAWVRGQVGFQLWQIC